MSYRDYSRENVGAGEKCAGVANMKRLTRNFLRGNWRIYKHEALPIKASAKITCNVMLIEAARNGMAWVTSCGSLTNIIASQWPRACMLAEAS